MRGINERSTKDFRKLLIRAALGFRIGIFGTHLVQKAAKMVSFGPKQAVVAQMQRGGKMTKRGHDRGQT
jgi:hypothetical protein